MRGKFLCVHLVIFRRVLLVLFIRLKDGVLEHLLAHLVTAAERHRDVVGVLVRVRLGPVRPLLPVLTGRIGRFVAIALVTKVAVHPACGSQTHLGQFLLVTLVDRIHSFSLVFAELLAHTGLILIVHENASLFKCTKLKVHGGLRVQIKQFLELFTVKVHGVGGGALLELGLVLIDGSVRSIVNVRFE